MRFLLTSQTNDLQQKADLPQEIAYQAILIAPLSSVSGVILVSFHVLFWFPSWSCSGSVLVSFPDWAQLPQIRATQERLTRERKVLSFYELFFSQGTSELLARAVLAVRDRLKRSKVHQVELLDGQIKQVEHYELTKISLGYLIDLLVSLDFSPHDFMVDGSSSEG